MCMAGRLILKNSLPSVTHYDINTQPVLTDLGKPTKRGIKKCFNCGIYNGTRGLICKNKKCNTPFKGINSECDSSIDAIRLITGNTRRVYSVLVKEKGPHYRGFVQLPFTEDGEVNNRKVALCFVDSCQRLFDNSILKCHEKKHNDYQHDSFCTHIESAFKSVHVAKAYDIDKNTLSKLDFSEEIKLRLLKLADETIGTVVQQVSKSVMAVKCHVSSKYPLGYLHLTFINCKRKDIFDKYSCNCNQFKDHTCSTNADPKCIHYYACIWAFANCPSLPKEFIPIVASEVPYSFGEINLTHGLLNDCNKKKLKRNRKNKLNIVEVSLCLVKTVVLNKNSIVMYLQVDRQQKINNSNIFSIQWSPNVLPTSKFGILRLKFKIGKFN
ncbi:uncharacterized protein C2orf42 homolog isoform X2 [Agrilus planipennis]|uniref:Uncharacterized protein C2orf42 homolog isoform X2 n=1 Tax=Agrilus planipennis TaxID=224129 RepID=A0A1W4WKH7_AGRPL|nr:uncharacterized protein C2orf42 homolog isoform X2 [Agrilus planipennis]